MISISYALPADQAAADLRNELGKAAESADALGDELLGLLMQFPTAKDAYDAADVLYLEADAQLSAIYRFADLVKSIARRI